MLKKWANDIQAKTKNMNRQQKIEYVLTYYWYHILIGALLIGLLILTIYHIGWGKKKMDFSLAAVNQEVDFERDQKLMEEFSEYSLIDCRKIRVDSDYLISYGNRKLEGVNESSYEKFFFNWAANTLDAIIMPESFLKYCKEQNAEVADIKELLGNELKTDWKECVFKENGRWEGIYIEKTKLEGKFWYNQDDRVILVFPREMKHKEACKQFLEYIFSEQKMKGM